MTYTSHIHDIYKPYAYDALQAEKGRWEAEDGCQKTTKIDARGWPDEPRYLPKTPHREQDRKSE